MVATWTVSRRAVSVRQLASDFGLDLDEALVTLWDAGFDAVNDVDDRISRQDVARAQHALGLGTLREMRSVAYWERTLSLSRAELRNRLAALDIRISHDSRVLPKGALSKLRRAGVAGPAMAKTQLSDREIARGEASLVDRGPDFTWQPIGLPRSCDQVDVDELVRIHQTLEERFAQTADPISPPGVRDQGLLESAAHRADTSLGGERKYPSAEMTAAALLHSLTHNHAFFNGNKRTALVAMLVSLDRNGILLTSDEQSLFRFVLRVAQHRMVPEHWSYLADREVMAIAEWICANSRPIAKGERAITWRELRRNLTRFGCTFEGPLPGNKMKVKRLVTTKGRFGREKRIELTAHAWYGGDGREVAEDHLHYIRQCLKLDDASGYDSAHFYGTDPRDPDLFISEYRNILKRLAKL